MIKKIFLLVLILLIAPSLAYASWWNPFSWSIFSSVFHSKSQTQVVSGATPPRSPAAVEIEATTSSPISTTTTPASESDTILCNGQYYKKCPIEQLQVCPTDTTIDAYCSTPKVPKAQIAPVAPKQQNLSKAVVNSVKTEIKPTPISQPIITPDYKPQIINILSAAKGDYLKMLQYSGECVSMMNKREADLQTLDYNRNQILQSVTSDEYLAKRYGLFYQMIDAERAVFKAYKVSCGGTFPDYINGVISGINSEMLLVQNSNKPATSDDLVTYQVKYFGSDNTEKLRQGIKLRIDDMSVMIAKSNTSFSSLLSSMTSYVSGVIKSSTPPPQYYIPVAPSIPQLPQTTHCTISRDRIQSYVNCTTY